MNEKRWFVTVGVPGGEFAVKAENAEDAACEIAPPVPSRFATLSAFDIVNASLPESYLSPDPIIVRPAPPDLAEWLDCEMHGGNNVAMREKVPGGWCYFDCEPINGSCTTRCFVPVPLAANITVVEEAPDA